MNSLFIFLITGLLVVVSDDDTRQGRRLKGHVERKEYADVIEEITYHDRRKEFATVRYFDRQGNRLSEEHYNNYQLRIKHGQTRFWYPNGQVHWSCDFNNNLISGPFFAYYEDGSLKRREYYKYGIVRRGQCFTPEGVALACEPFIRKAQFAGGREKFLQFLRKKLEKVKPEMSPTFVTLEGMVLPDGTALIHRALPERDISMQVLATIGEMPRWEPAMVDGVPVQSAFALTLILRDGSVFMFGEN